MKKNVAYLYDPVCLEHDTGLWHPESPERLRAIEQTLTRLKPRLMLLSPSRVPEKLLLQVHMPKHIETVRFACEMERPLDADTICVRRSWDSALMAAGAGIVGLDALKAEQVDRAFCAIRPPGHHATRNQSMGFCLFNNIAVAARYAQSIGYEKVAIIDFDVHHGNGTQDIFYDDGSVLYLSTHQHPAYPGTGAPDECGRGEGKGTIFNFPFPPSSGDAELIPVYSENLPHILADFGPDIILVSAGYDLHEADPLAQLEVSTEGVRAIVRAILDAADALPTLFFLEGGYDVKALSECVYATVEEMIKQGS